MNSEAQGRSGARFHTSYDKRYVVKTISSEDVAEMHNILKKYHQVITDLSYYNPFLKQTLISQGDRRTSEILLRDTGLHHALWHSNNIYDAILAVALPIDLKLVKKSVRVLNLMISQHSCCSPQIRVTLSHKGIMLCFMNLSFSVSYSLPSNADTKHAL